MDLSISSAALYQLNMDMDRAMTDLVKTMEAKNSTSGVLTLKLGIEIAHQYKKDADDQYIKDDDGNPIRFSIPTFEHKLSSKIQIDGFGKYEGKAEGDFEMYYDTERQIFILKEAGSQTKLF